jgi:hypothetical protein
MPEAVTLLLVEKFVRCSRVAHLFDHIAPKMMNEPALQSAEFTPGNSDCNVPVYQFALDRCAKGDAPNEEGE